MDAVDGWLGGPVGPALAILLMAAATYGLRVAGVLIMGRVRITPTVQRALEALPGSIVAATVVPIAIRSGPAAVLGVLAAIATVRATGSVLAAMASGMVLAAGARALGL